MDSYDFSRETGRPVSPPLPEDYSMSYLPQMSTYSGSTQSRNTSVSQPIDFGGSTSRYTGATQSRGTSVPQIEYGGSTSRYTGATQSRRTSVQQIGYGSVSQSGGATGSSASHRTSTRRVPDEEKSAVVTDFLQSGLTQKQFTERTGISRSKLSRWVVEKGASVRGNYHSYSAEEKASAISAMQTSESIESISRRTGIPPSTLTTWRRGEGSSRDAR